MAKPCQGLLYQAPILDARFEIKKVAKSWWKIFGPDYVELCNKYVFYLPKKSKNIWYTLKF